MVNHVMFEMNVSRNSHVLKHDDLRELHVEVIFNFTTNLTSLTGDQREGFPSIVTKLMTSPAASTKHFIFCQ